MADDESTNSLQTGTCGVNYVVIVIACILAVICICLGIWIYYKRKQNGYVSIRGNEDELQKYKTMVEQERKEKEDALRRLSRLASDRLTDDNPNIADLSDLKRPTKLADEFSELYDNEWTDAYESLDDRTCIREEEKIAFLLKILQTPDSAGIDKGLIKIFKDERKRLGSRTGQYVSQKVFETVKAEFKSSPWEAKLLNTPVQTYCKQCAELSWFLAVQDPPLDINFADKNKNNFKPYTKTGSEFNFIVWPPLFLQADGNILAKGIAQFR